MGLVSVPYEYSGAPKKAVQVYKQVILGDNPVGFWLLNETSGTIAYDLTSNGNNGTYVDMSPSFSNNFQQLSGNGGITTPENIIVLSSPFSYEIWCDLSSTESDRTIATMSSENSPYCADWWPAFIIGSNGLPTSAGSANQTIGNFGTPTQCVVVWDGTVVFYYVNSEVIISVTGGQTTNTPNYFNMGFGCPSDYPNFVGGLKWGSVYQYALTSE